MPIPRRNIVLSILFSLITGGLYAMYWFYRMTNETAELSDDFQLSGGLSILFTLITCGIYGVYWAYKIGLAVSDMKRKRGVHTENHGVLFLILSLCGLVIVDYCIVQDELNQWSVA